MSRHHRWANKAVVLTLLACVAGILTYRHYDKAPSIQVLSAGALQADEARLQEPTFKACIEQNKTRQVAITAALVSLCRPVASKRLAAVEANYPGSAFLSCLNRLTPSGGGITEGNLVLCEAGRTPKKL